ncbi:MAG: ribonuclease P protein subunit [Candidatus Hodarchaeales archaeon]
MFLNNRLPIEKNLLRIRMICQNCEVEYSGQVFVGWIKKETRNTWQIVTENGQKTIPKLQSHLYITINNRKYKINGRRMKGRHEDRIKHRRKRKW